MTAQPITNALVMTRDNEQGKTQETIYVIAIDYAKRKAQSRFYYFNEQGKFKQNLQRNLRDKGFTAKKITGAQGVI